jgi:hypothetical protein
MQEQQGLQDVYHLQVNRNDLMFIKVAIEATMVNYARIQEGLAQALAPKPETQQDQKQAQTEE